MNRLVAALDQACPGFVPGPYDTGEYGWIASFVQHVIAMHLAGQTGAVRAAFAVIERTIADNGPDVELAIVGFLEDLQNGNLHKDGSRPADFRSYLGPQSLVRWDALNGLWQAVSHANSR